MTMKPNHHHHHHHHHRPLRLSLPSSRLYPPLSSSSPFPSPSISTPSKLRRHGLSPPTSYSSLFLLLFSLLSLYSLLPFLQSSPPSFSLFPFSFLVSLLSFFLFSFFSPPTLPPLDPLLLRPLLLKSSLLSLTLLLRFQALRFCGTAATILADLSGSLLAFSLSKSHHIPTPSKILGFASLFLSLLTLSNSWDRTGCAPLSDLPPPDEGCNRLFPILLPFLSGFLGHYEKAFSSSNWGGTTPLRQLGRKRVRSLSLALATLILFFPALFSFLIAGDVEGGGGENGGSVSVWSLGWPLFNTVLFGVILNENFTDDKVIFSAKDFRRDFVVTFFCTLSLEMFYSPKLSLPGFLFCGLLMWVSVRELGSSSLDYLELGNSDPYESLYSMVMNPVRHILSERKSRKIALFLLINTGYMVVEFVAGFMSNSLGLISDACHMLFDCAALGIGLYASYISRLPADHRFNYGRGRTEVLSGYVNAVLLVLVGALIVLESFERIFDPQEISTNSLLIVSVGGLLVNMVGLIFFHEEHHHAHGGGGKCTQSHSHSDLNSHHHDHQHNHAHNTIDHDHGPNVEHHERAEVSHESSSGHSHDDHNHHHPCGNHNDHQHDSNKEHIDSSKIGRETDNHDHLSHGHEHDHQFHQDHEHKSENHIHSHSGDCKHGLQVPDISSKSCHGHLHEDIKHSHCHGDKEIDKQEGNSNPTDMADHSHSCSFHSKKPSTHKDSRKHLHIDHNMEGIFLHVLADTMGSVGVVISTLLIKYKGWLIADPACSIFISVMIVASVIPLLRNSAEILLQRISRSHEQDLKVVMDDLMRVKGVFGVQKFHTWNYTNNDIVGTLHLHVSADIDKASVKNRASGLLNEAGIKDITIHVECAKE